MMCLSFRGKNNLWVIICLIFICCSKQESSNIEEESPNILLINVDDLGWKDLGVYGSNFYLTPNIDRLANAGKLFTQAYAAAANCAPSRACMLSGLQSSRHGIYTVGTSERGDSRDRKLIPVVNETVLADSFVTIAEMLNANGYLCATMGKWHISNDPKTQGFDINVAGSRKGHPSTYFSPYDMAQLEDGPDGEFLTDRIASEATKFLKEHAGDKFFLYLPFYAVHTPLMGKKEKIEKYQKRISGSDQINAVYA
ncbi:MAG: sulfatase-like hydrolase/transferase, partial [Saprospiraceae bacterium]|nr:sulfatase-like hydrolase/transferase [Saprospiraceae bacterium]